MRLIQFTDCHLYAERGYQGMEQVVPYETLQRVLANVARRRPEAVIVTGDISGDGTTTSYDNFCHAWQMSTIDAPLFVVAGNHDVPGLINHYFARQWLDGQAVSLSDSWFLYGLTSHFQGTQGRVSEEQLTALHAHLTEYAHAHHLVAVHHHPVPVKGWMDTHEWLNRHQFTALVSQHENLQGVIHGHVHTSLEYNLGHCRVFSTPSTCWQFAIHSEFATTQAPPGFRELTLHDDGRISSQLFEV